jgi:hypothetical protein
VGTGRKRLKGAAALSIVALATAMGAASASADEVIICGNCEIQPPSGGTAGRINAFSKIEANSGQAFNKVSENGAFLKFSWGKDFSKHDGVANAFHKIESNTGQAFNKIGDNGAFQKFSWGRD